MHGRRQLAGARSESLNSMSTTYNADPATTEVFPSERRRALIDQALAAATDFGEGCPPRLAEAIRYALLSPGKRLRPQLVLLAAEACGGTIEGALPAAVAVEMIHAYSLVHDDLPAMDDDDLRRGRPTCHRQFDEATAILAGDALQARALEIAATEIKPAARAQRCVAELAHAAGPEALIGGQADDLAAEFQQVDPSQLESIHRRKTGALFRASVRLGALTADASEAQLKAVSEYGDALGLAFQVVDDLLDVAGVEDRVGKKVGKDREQGKQTYPGLLGVAGSRERATRLLERACAAIEVLGEAGRPMAELARYVEQRNH